MKDKNGLIVTKDQNKLLWLIDFIKFSSNSKVWCVSLIFMVLSFLLACFVGNSNIFAASGGVVTILGLLIFIGITTPVELEEIQEVINSRTSSPQVREDNGAEVIAHIAKTVEDVLYARGRQVLGFSITLVGTLVWAYGWLIEYLPWFETINIYMTGGCQGAKT
ncbi:hypothetical protein [Litoribrevibacter albus]|uniref:Uncharacterized protein n=1 Tax=Litoribrevibacter albus TaxID=1473156 RepID=A0AA37S8L1_9GAMM|nr:hypothetical protein [Litoribrevibacter albus]GLQ30458.1 hypothetical protein GCM10007876_09360 [Litoribrevibacter albus]